MNLSIIGEKIVDVMKATEKREREIEKTRMDELKNYYKDENGYTLDEWANQMYEVMGIEVEGTTF